MKNIYLNIFRFNKKLLSKSINSLKKNNILGLPTETVYGLAGNAYSKLSIKKIFKLKKRPAKNPLIIHYFNIKDASRDVILNKDFFSLYNKFCPGPITFVLKKKKKSKLQASAIANLKTVAIRFPKHKILKSILKNINFPLAIPSGNKSSSISPVSAQDVVDEFKHKIKIVLDGGNSKIGIESTVIDLSHKIKILRPGAITPKQISEVLKRKITIDKKLKSIKAPGNLKKHYSPGIPMKLNKKKASKKTAFIVLGNKFTNKKNIFNLSKKSNLTEAATNLYKTFRKIKKLNYKKIHVIKIPNIGIGIAINDRLKHAANIK